jgi:hypothetical protein
MRSGARKNQIYDVTWYLCASDLRHQSLATHLEHFHHVIMYSLLAQFQSDHHPVRAENIVPLAVENRIPSGLQRRLNRKLGPGAKDSRVRS